LAAFCVVLGAACATRADVIGLGLDWRTGIYAQEYWEKGSPHYLLVNLTKEAAEITVHDWQRGQAPGPAVAGPWKVPAGGTAAVDAKPLLGGQGLRQFVLGGKKVLGLLPSPVAPGYDGPGYATSHGLNGSGGSVAGVYLVQPKLEFKGGETVKIILHVAKGSGTIKFKRQAEASTEPLRPGSLAVESVTCETLPITKEEKQFVIDSDAPKADAKSHEVVVNLVLPQTKSAEFFMLDGWLGRRDGGGSGITRGIWVTAP
jgi:hypothetical protein